MNLTQKYATLEAMEQESNETILSWTAPEFVYYEKSEAWFAVFGILAAALLVVSLLMKNYFFALLVPIASFLIYVYAKKHPRKITVKLTEERIHIGEYFSLAHKEITSFWIFEEMETKILSLETKKALYPKISVLLADEDPREIREAVSRFVKEKKHEENLIDILARKLKF